MKTKLVLWGANAQDERLLVAIELVVADNKVKVFTFPESEITEEVYQEMMSEWRDNKEYALPANHTLFERELTVTEGILPDDLKVERTDVVLRAQTEWNFVVLSSKLHAAYESELNELREKIENLKGFDRDIWDNLRNFWSKVQGQVRDRNLFKHHFWGLRDATNELFAKMKELRGKVEDEFKESSEKEMSSFMATLGEIEEKAKKGLRLKPLFDELKNLQRKFHDTKFTREHRSKVWAKLDASFKMIKEKRFGESDNSNQSHLDRLNKRYNGLISAIGRMEQSINRDKDELNFQNKRIEDTDGQLEAQIREAKIRMIDERVKSKEEKLQDMYKTKEMLEQRMTSEKAKEEKRQQVEAAKKAAEEKIAQEIKDKAQEMESNSEQLEKAAEAIAETKKKAQKSDQEEESVMDKVAAKVEDIVTDTVDTVKAVAEVVGDKIEKAVDDLKGDDNQDEPLAATEKQEESLMSKAGKMMDKAVENVKAVAEVVEDKIEDAVEKFTDAVEKEKAEEAKEDAAKNPSDEDSKEDDSLLGKMGKVVGDAIENVKAAAEVVEDKIEDAVEKVVDKAKAAAEVVEDKIEDVVEDIKDEVKKEDDKEEDKD